MKEFKINNQIWQMSAPTVRVLKNADKKSGDIDKAIYMIAALTNHTEAEIEDLELKEFMELQKGLADFLGDAGVIA
ncbi:MAG: phage tail assembly protein [Campylobacter sp.]|nr:phage tail assembly protein [Campylobacter sp.]